jgi:hypothetical protein
MSLMTSSNNLLPTHLHVCARVRTHAHVGARVHTHTEKDWNKNPVDIRVSKLQLEALKFPTAPCSSDCQALVCLRYDYWFCKLFYWIALFIWICIFYSLLLIIKLNYVTDKSIVC